MSRANGFTRPLSWPRLRFSLCLRLFCVLLGFEFLDYLPLVVALFFALQPIVDLSKGDVWFEEIWVLLYHGLQSGKGTVHVSGRKIGRADLIESAGVLGADQ